MSRPYNRLTFLVLAALMLTVYWSCEQPDDVFTPVATTNLQLIVERLPEPPDGLVYELWVSKEVVRDTALTTGDIISLGKFSYMVTDTLVAFLDADGELRADSNQFVLEGDLFSYKSIFVSIERVDDTEPTRPGPIMLVDYIVPIEDISPTMIFPLSEDSLSRATARFNLEAVSDNDRNANDGHGIWFSSYRTALDTIPDTIGLTVTYDSVEIVPVVDTIIVGDDTTYDTTNLDSLYASRPCLISNIQVCTTQVLYSEDTLLLNIDSWMHIHVVFDVDSCIDSIPPFYKPTIQFDWTIVGQTSNRVTYDVFTQDNFDLPDYSAWGWEYAGWVVSPYIDKDATAPFTPPGWRYKSEQRNWIPGDTGGVFSTGTFIHIDMPDDGDPYTFRVIAGVREIYDPIGDSTYLDTVYKRPRYPGEDFLNSDSLEAATGGQLSSIDLMPAAHNGHIEGTVFISLEPVNRDTTSKTNFPLIAFFGELPNSRPAPPVINMANGSSDVPGNISWGFPEIRVVFSRL